MQRQPFPSPTNIRRQTPHELYAKDAEHLFNNLTKEFEKNAQLGETKQSILIRRRGSWGRRATAWIEWHQQDGDQRQYSIDYCNQKLSTTGWRISDLTFREVPKYADRWRQQQEGHVMWAIVVKMEYTCDDACAAK